MIKPAWSKRVILTDYDGVMTDFTQAFDVTMHGLGHKVVREDCYSLIDRYDASEAVIWEILHEFVHSDDMIHLPPVGNSIRWIRELREDGYLFHCITSVPRFQSRNRKINAEGLYGHNVFQRLECIGLKDSKREYLKAYEGTGCYWIEDKPENAVMGLEFGLRPILLDHPYNRNFYHADVIRATDWKHIYDIITNEV